jgi:hypothetical protein
VGESRERYGARQTVRRIAAWAYAGVSAGVVAFQLALAAGMPWGEFAMGGAFRGAFPPAMRAAAVVQAALIALEVVVVLARAGVILPRWARVSRWLIWVIVVMGGIALVLNTITPSARERAIWAPVAAILLAASLTVALASKGE